MNVFSHDHNILGAVKRDLYTDLNLITECGRSLSVHKVVAATVSSKIKGLLLSKDRGELPIRNVKYQAMEKIFDFAYNGKIYLTSDAEKQDFVDAFDTLKINLGKKVSNLVKKLDQDRVESEKENSSQEFQEFKCVTCDKKFDSRQKLLRHSREVHSKEPKPPKQKFRCEGCSESYTVFILVEFFKNKFVPLGSKRCSIL